VLVTIARYAVVHVDGVQQMTPVPADIARLFQRGLRQDGVLLDLSENKIRFNIYVIMAPHVNLLETSRQIQTAVSEAIDNMVGVPVDAVNVFVEDVHYSKGEVV
jgi:uncharacterized alkaline shock family protein YloU